MKLVFDIGGTYMRLATAEGNLLTSELSTVSTPKGYDAALNQFEKMAKQLTLSEPLASCAGGVPGVLDKQKSMLIDARNLPNWVNKPLQADLSKVLGCPVTLENDTAIGALGEAHAGIDAGRPGCRCAGIRPVGGPVCGRSGDRHHFPEQGFTEAGHPVLDRAARGGVRPAAASCRANPGIRTGERLLQGH